MQQLNLLRRIEISERPPISQQTALVYGRYSTAVRFLQALKRTAELAVDVIDNAGPRRPWILVGRNDLVADRGQGPGFIERKKSPRRPILAAGDSSSSGCG
jgi:hypothetical protein